MLTVIIMKKRTKILIVSGVIVLFVLVAFIAARSIRNLTNEVSTLKGENKILKSNIAQRDLAIIKESEKTDSLEKINNKLKKDYLVLSLEKQKISIELVEVLARLQTITTDSSYQYLQKVAYNFPGVLKYLFNELQVRGIHKSFVQLQASTQMINTLEQQLKNCNEQVQKHEEIKTGLENIISNLNLNAQDYKSVIANDSIVMRDQGKLINKGNRRKNLWKGTTVLEAAVIIGLLL